MSFRWLSLSALLVLPSFVWAQGSALSAVDSALVGRMLLAEDARDSTAPALAQGLRHDDRRLRSLAWRALGRIRDPQFGARDSLPTLAAPVAWPEPGWRLRYRALAAQRERCDSIRRGLDDFLWHVRLRAADLVTVTCARDTAVVATLVRWVDSLRGDTRRRQAGGVSWHAAAHAIVALARIAPAQARRRISVLASHQDWHVRLYSARAAAVLKDTARLRALVRDADDNVREAAIDSLSSLTGHADDAIYLAALDARGAPAVRAGARALKGSPRPDVRDKANAVFERWVVRANASERDVRVALLEAAGRPASDDRPPALVVELPPRAVALALGAEVRLRVTMAPGSGGQSFVVRLRGDVAPMMAARVLALAAAGYYDGGSWHRVEPDFVIQGAGPGPNEYIGYHAYFRDELGTIPHPRGTVGMSTRGHDTGDAQWFINLRDNPRLVRDYTVFAEVVEGMGVVDGIFEGDVIATIREVERR
jgi:peptidyl-prolyl cis-trans isomerase B (cyclophilin B)